MVYVKIMSVSENVPQCSLVCLGEKFQHAQRWSDTNKLQVNVSKPKNSYLDVALPYHNPCHLLSEAQLRNFSEFVFLLPVPLLHMLSTPCLLLISKRAYLHGLRHLTCMICVIYKLSSFSALTLSVGRQEEHPACKN